MKDLLNKALTGLLLGAVLAVIWSAVDGARSPDEQTEHQKIIAELEAEAEALREKLRRQQEGSAEPTEPQEEPADPSPNDDLAAVTPGCMSFSQVLRVGSRGEEVKDLQKFLQSNGYFEYQEITGYFGPETEQAVKDFQAAHDIVSQGDPQSTGFGQVGNETQEKLIDLTCETE